MARRGSKTAIRPSFRVREERDATSSQQKACSAHARYVRGFTMSQELRGRRRSEHDRPFKCSACIPSGVRRAPRSATQSTSYAFRTR